MTKRDAEAEAMEVAINYLKKSDWRTRERFMFHLVHRFFPKRRFEPKRYENISIFANGKGLLESSRLP